MNCTHDETLNNVILRSKALAHNGLPSTDRQHSSLEAEALGILHGPKRFHHHYFERELSVITDHKPPVAIFMKHMAILSQ